MTTDFRYRAFLSYSHVDAQWARWLHRRLEGFRLRELAGRDGLRGPVPSSLTPIFRDREEFTAGHSLSDQTISALASSEALIVLCSPAAAGSRYVNEEIRLFKAAGPDRPIVPVIADGTPGDPEQECFPPALRFKVGADGVVTSEPEPDTIAADLRETGDGSELALAKTVSGLVGLPPDLIYKRAERERRRQLRIRAAVAAAFVVISGAGTYYLWRSQRQDVVLLDTAAACARYLPPDSAPLGLSPGPLEQCMKSLEALRVGAASDPRDAAIVKLIAEGKTEEAERLQIEAAQDDEAAGKARNRKAAERHRTIAGTSGLADPRKAREHYAKAVRLDPDNVDGMFLHAQAEEQAGNLPAAEKAFETVLLLKDANEFDVYHSYRFLGTIKLARGELEQAREYHALALREAKRLADRFPDSPPFQRGLSLAHAGLADVMRAQGDFDGAVLAFSDALAVAQRLASASSADLLLARHLASSHHNLALALKGKGEPDRALEAYRQSIAIFETLLNEHPKDVQLQYSLSVAYRGAAGTLLALGRKDEALQMSLDGMAIVRRLADSDRDNVNWQQELSLAHIDLGDALRRQGKIEEALKAYRDSVAASEQQSPDPSAVRTQLLLASALWGIAELSPDPRGDGTRAVAILERLQGDGRLAPSHQRWLDTIKTVLAKAERRAPIQRDFLAAQAAFKREEYPAAVELQISVIKETETLETEARGGPGPDTVNALGTLSWYLLFARRFDEALAATERALVIDPAATWITTNRAHALMFLERVDEAQALYLAHKGAHIAEAGKLWDEVIEDDFAQLEKAGRAHRHMAEIRKFLGATEPAAGQQSK
jgi:tetratricopeptide (TPR) repeat protein